MNALRSSVRTVILVGSLGPAALAIGECRTDIIQVAGKVEGGSAGNTVSIQLIFGSKRKVIEHPATTAVEQSNFAVEVPFHTEKRKHYPLLPLPGVGENCTRLPEKVVVQLVHEGRVLDEAALNFRKGFTGDLKTGRFVLRRELVLHGSRIP
jgi:hypothetical protein